MRLHSEQFELSHVDCSLQSEELRSFDIAIKSFSIWKTARLRRLNALFYIPDNCSNKVRDGFDGINTESADIALDLN